MAQGMVLESGRTSFALLGGSGPGEALLLMSVVLYIFLANFLVGESTRDTGTASVDFQLTCKHFLSTYDVPGAAVHGVVGVAGV